MSHGQLEEEGNPNPNPGSAKSGPAANAEDYDFTPKPPPDGSRLRHLVGISPLGAPQVIPGAPRSLKTTPPTQRLSVDGPQVHRNPVLERMGQPHFPKNPGRRRTTEEVDAAVNQALMEPPFVDDTGLSPRGRRMVVVDETFYAQPQQPRHRPQPIRKGAGKGPRGQVYLARC